MKKKKLTKTELGFFKTVETAIKKLGVQKEKVYVNIEDIVMFLLPVYLFLSGAFKRKKLKTGCKVGATGLELA